MEDIEVPDDPKDDPVSPDPDESSPDGKPATPKGEAPADADGDDNKKEDGEGGDPEDGRGEATYEKLLAKYKGNKEELAKGYFESANSNARLHERLAKNEEFIRGKEQPTEVDEAQIVAEDPDAKEIADNYNEVRTGVQAEETRNRGLIAKYGELERKIANLKGQLQRADVDAKAEIREELNDVIGEQHTVHSDIKDSDREIRSKREKLGQLNRDYKVAQQRAKEHASRLREEGEEQRRAAQDARAEFSAAMEFEARARNIPLESKTYRSLHQTIADRIYAYLSRLPNGAPGVEIRGAVKALMTEYDEAWELKARFQRKSDTKRDASGTPSKGKPQELGKEPPPPKDGRWTKAFVEDRAKRMLGG